MIQATLHDESTYQEYKGLINGNKNTVKSLITTAQAALSGLNPDLCQVTAKNTIDFERLRKKKTALYVLIRQQDIPYLSFLVNLFFTKLCQSLQDDLTYSREGLPVHLCLDEFGQFFVPGFETFAATSRKYQVVFCLLLQSLSQLTTRYGREQAETILNAIGSEQYFPGMPIDLASQISRRMGQKSDGNNRHKPLMREHEVIHLKEDEALLLYGGRDPIKLKLKPYYKQRKLRKLSNLAPANIPTRPLPAIQYVPLQPADQLTASFVDQGDINIEEEVEAGKAPQEGTEPSYQEPPTEPETSTTQMEDESDDEITQSSNG